MSYTINLYSDSLYTSVVFTFGNPSIQGANKFISATGLTTKKTYWYSIDATDTVNGIRYITYGSGLQRSFTTT
jgi:hypothetical protein